MLSAGKGAAVCALYELRTCTLGVRREQVPLFTLSLCVCVSLLVLSTPKRALLQPELVCSRADDRVNPFSHLTNRARVECGGNRRYLHPDAISKRRHLPAASKQGALNQGAGRKELVVARWEDEMGRGLARTDGRLISLGNSSGQSRLLSFAGSIRSSGLGRCSLLHSAHTHTHTVIPSFSPLLGSFMLSDGLS